ncbi:acyltransferase family protein [Corticimicrobacter populi]|uniref:Acyltransferase n=1 Tax=Corticimicrobacter populi TaxID=2175229 RepID=A0A2V1JXE8_9BURK|nr:acyltransferase family protein [Corticimicrobacter populi]PWF22164.1 acyltransferase [Corticimicrobacter populi]
MCAHTVRPDFRQDIQGLRAVAVLAVMVFHANGSWLPAGFIGVDIFFVISGFIVSRLILGRQGHFDWRGFFLGRLRRIVPAYLFMLAVVALIAVILLTPQDFNFFSASLKNALLFNSNNYFASFGNYFSPSAYELPLLHTWSLAIEMQFYLVLPLLLVLLPRAALRYVVLVLIVAAIGWSEYQSGNHDSMYFSFLARSAEFGFGILLAAYPLPPLSRLQAEAASISGAALLLLGVFFIPETNFPGVWVLLPCMGTLLIIAARDASLNRMLSSRCMVGIGAISYSLYLWHWPILAFMRYYIQQYELSITWLLVYVVSALGLAVFSYLCIEKFFRRHGNDRVFLGGLLVTLAVVAGFQVQSVGLNAGVVVPLPVERTRYADSAKICHGQVVGDCLQGDVKEQPWALVIGDSHAAQLNLAFDALGRTRHQSFKLVTGSSCVPIDHFDVDRLPAWARQACMDQIAYARALVASSDIIILAAMWQYQMESPDFILALEGFLSAMQLRGARVIVLGQVPMLDSNVIRMHRFAELGLPPGHVRLLSTVDSDNAVKAIVEKYGNAVFVDVAGLDLLRTPPFYKESMIYMDSHHLNEVGAHEYARELENILTSLSVNTGKK